MNKNRIFGVLILLISGLFVGGVFYLKGNSIDNKKLSLGKCDFNIEVISNEEQRKKGLSDRDSLCQNCGMLFLFEQEGIYSFWMKDMRFSIDMIWLRDDEVIDIKQNINYQSRDIYSSKEKADGVLELNAGDASRCKIKIGDSLNKK